MSHAPSFSPNSIPTTIKNPLFPSYPKNQHDLISLSDLNSSSLINRALTEADPHEFSLLAGDEELQLTPVQTFKELAIYAFAKFCSVGVVNPLGVASTVLQVQYLPSDEWLQKEKSKNGSGNANMDEEEDDEDYYGEDERYREDSEAEIFDEDIYGVPRNSTTSAFAEARHPSSSTDHLGYVVPTDEDVEDDAVRPVYQLPHVEKGVWDAMKVVVKHPTEGWQGLWKGAFTTWLHQMAQIMLQPSLESLLNESLGIQDEDNFDLTYDNELTTLRPDLPTVVFSSVLVGWLLSPLELVKTRLIVQTSSPVHRKYNGVIDCLKTTVAEEGLGHIYLDSTILVPTLLTHTLLPLFANTRRYLIGSIFHIHPHESPFLHALADLAFSSIELLVTLPLETVRKRLQVQRWVLVQQGKPFSSSVQLSQRPYKGILDCVKRIIREEGGPREKRSRRRRRGRRERREEEEEEEKSKKRSGGIFGWMRKYGGLYKGSSVKFGGNVSLFVINCFGGSEVETEW